MEQLSQISPDKPVLIAGPTASGKSALALRIAEAGGGVIINADALQVYDGWRILTARPDETDLIRAQHYLYGHIPFDQPFTTGDWLRQVGFFLQGGPRPIIVGGTGLYFSALTRGLANIPPTPPEVRDEADTLMAAHGRERLLRDLDPVTLSRIDQLNPARVQRAWEAQRTTGRGLAELHDATPPPLLPPENAHLLCLMPQVPWLNDRIETRFDQMLDQGALIEAERMRPHWDPGLQSSKAIGAQDLIAHLDGEITLDQARERAVIETRQYAKRQRTWFRSKMRDWQQIDPADL